MMFFGYNVLAFPGQLPVLDDQRSKDLRFTMLHCGDRNIPFFNPTVDKDIRILSDTHVWQHNDV